MAALSVEELEEIFVDVRKAYRLLYLYQRRILDTVEYISSIIEERIVTGYADFVNNPFKNESKIKFEDSAWKWLPMYYYEFLFFANKEIGDNRYWFAVAVHADNGYENTKTAASEIDVERFVSVEKSETQLYLYVGKNIWKVEDFKEGWWSNNYSSDWEHLEENKHFLSKRFPLSKFKDEDGIIDGLREFQTYCHDKGMSDFLSLNI